MVMTYLSLIVGFMNRKNLRYWFIGNRFPNIGGELNTHPHWQVLIFTVSQSDVSNWVINFTRPHAIGLLITDFSQPAAEKIKQFAQKQSIEIILSEIINNPDDPAEVAIKTKSLIFAFKDLNLTSIAVDITGGKTPMSLGAFMAAEENACDSIYVSCRYHNKMPDMTTAELKAISQAST